MRIWILTKMMPTRPEEQTVLVASGLDIVTNLIRKTYDGDCVVSLEEGSDRGWWDVNIGRPGYNDGEPVLMYRIEQRELMTTEPTLRLDQIAPRLHPSLMRRTTSTGAES